MIFLHAIVMSCMKMANSLRLKELQNVTHSDRPTARGCESLHLYWEILGICKFKSVKDLHYGRNAASLGKGKLW